MITSAAKLADGSLKGHSLGAALALFATTNMVNGQLDLPEYLYTYGTPRVGNYAFAQYFNSTAPKLYRVSKYPQSICICLLTSNQSINAIPFLT
jgi:predicted lipase